MTGCLFNKGIWQSVMDKEVIKEAENQGQKKGGRKAAKRVLNSIERRIWQDSRNILVANPKELDGF